MEYILPIILILLLIMSFIMYIEYKKQINEAIEVLKLCNSKCAKEVIDILRGEKNEKK